MVWFILQKEWYIAAVSAAVSFYNDLFLFNHCSNGPLNGTQSKKDNNTPRSLKSSTEDNFQKQHFLAKFGPYALQKDKKKNKCGIGLLDGGIMLQIYELKKSSLSNINIAGLLETLDWQLKATDQTSSGNWTEQILSQRHWCDYFAPQKATPSLRPKNACHDVPA